MSGFHRILTVLSLSLSTAALASNGAHAAAWTHDAYIWQRQPAPAALDTALKTTAPLINSYCVLASEISWRDAAPQIVRPRLDYAILSAPGKPVGLALRIGTVSTEKQFADALPKIVAEASALLQAARAAGLAPAELQIDFDCPEAKLPLYRNWLAALKTAAGETPLTFTALPCWLRHEQNFIALARAADGFVLQVHSLEKPFAIDSPFSLCDPGDALRWSREAGVLADRAGVTFRIALPTYGYTLGFNARGRLIGLAAETPRDWPADTQLRVIRSDPRALQALAQKIAAEPPPRATGIIWFRLPVEGDRLAWNAETFSAVVQNKPITSQLSAEIHRTQPGLAEIVIVNRGQTTEPLPPALRVTWTRGIHTVSWDGLGGYSFHCDSNTRNTLAGVRTLEALEIAPGRSRVIGWMRFDFPDPTTAENFSIHASIP